MYGIIYCYTNKINGKRYIGQTIRPNERKANHKHDALKKDGGYIFHSALRKYGINNFTYEILTECKTLEEMNNKESEYIIDLKTLIPNGYNMLISSMLMTEDIKTRIGKANKRYWNNQTPQQKKRRLFELANAHKNKPQTDFQKQKAREANQKSWLVIDPSGKSKIITNLRKFCIDNGLGTTGQSNLVRGSYKGWTCKAA